MDQNSEQWKSGPSLILPFKVTHMFYISFQTYKPGAPKEEHKRCVHFYACVCAFASDEKLAEEFAYYVNLDGTGKIAFLL